jgi:hypothetical protein
LSSRLALRDTGRLRLALIGAVLLALVLGIAAAPADGRTPRLTTLATTAAGVSYGLAFGDTLFSKTPAQVKRAFDDIVDTGASWARVDLNWADIQPYNAHEFSWDRFDEIVDQAQSHGVHLLATIGYTPPWARPKGCNSDKCRPAGPGEFATFATAAALRYHDAITTWEVWNEPNTAGFWAPKPNAYQYTTVLKDASLAIRAVQPDAFIMSGGLAATTTHAGAIGTRSFVRRMCKHGANDVVDAVAAHPYTYPFLPSHHKYWATAWNKLSSTKNSIEGILTAAGSPGMPIWLTEYGAPTNGPGTSSNGSPPIAASVDHVTMTRQAHIAASAVNTAPKTPDVGALFWYADKDGTGPNSDSYYGLRRNDGTRKPSYAAWRAALTELAQNSH